jgi:hypothetical protein
MKIEQYTSTALSEFLTTLAAEFDPEEEIVCPEDDGDLEDMEEHTDMKIEDYLIMKHQQVNRQLSKRIKEAFTPDCIFADEGAENQHQVLLDFEDSLPYWFCVKCSKDWPVNEVFTVDRRTGKVTCLPHLTPTYKR